MKQTQQKKNTQAGFVSIFTVLFFTLLVTIITVGFARIMLQDQTQAIDYDLSQSAYDAAESGVEDGKRALQRLNYHCNSSTEAGAAALCTAYSNALASGQCNALWSSATIRNDLGLTTSADGDVVLSSSEQLQQRYTCLQIGLATDDVENKLNENESWMIPLKSTGADARQVVVKWFAPVDKTNNGPFSLPGGGGGVSAPDLPNRNVWSNNDYPALLRVQLVGHNKTTGLDTYDNSTRTLFLYPANSGTNSAGFMTSDPRPDTGSAPNVYYSPQNKSLPVITSCATAATSAYSCSSTLSFNNAAVWPSADRDVYLRVTPLYRGSTVNVQMQTAAGGALQFNGVQPLVDSTGRTNNVFRRIQARVAYTADVSLFALQTSQPLCKDMLVSADRDDFVNNCN